jgi:hypothetical protein
MTPKEISAHNKAIAAKIVALNKEIASLYGEVVPPVEVGETVNYNFAKSTKAIVKKVTPHVSGESMMFIGYLCPILKEGNEGRAISYRASDYIGFVQDKFNK